MSKFLDENGLLYLWSKMKSLLSGKVDAEAGMGLSANDFTDACRAKLEGLESYTLPAATEQTLGGVRVGAGLAISGGVLSAASLDWSEIRNKPDIALKSDLTAVYRYKGSRASYGALPEDGNETGDVWNTEDTGMNYAWNGTAWDALGEALEIEAISNAEIDAVLAEG